MENKMKSVDIPNGFVFRGARGEVILMDFDDKGNVINNMTELSKVPDDNGKVNDVYRNDPFNILTFVHTVKGEERMLIKDLFSILLTDKIKKPIEVFKALKTGDLPKLAHDIRKDYIDRNGFKNEKEKEKISP
jgi:hypothetical protein